MILDTACSPVSDGTMVWNWRPVLILVPYFPHYRAHWIINLTVNEWSIFEFNFI